MQQAMPPTAKRKQRASSAPPQRPESGSGAARPDDAAEEAETELEGALLPRKDGAAYESETEEDHPPHVVDDEELVAIGNTAPRHDPEAQQDRRESPRRRAAETATGAQEASKRMTEAQQRNEVAQSEWQPMKLDGSDPAIARPAFLPYKEGTAPEGFVAKPEHVHGGPSPKLAEVLKPDTPPYVYMAEMGGFDAQLMNQIRCASNDYALSCNAGADDFYSNWKPFSAEEIVKGCGLLLRSGVAPNPQGGLVFSDPRNSFVFGDSRVRAIWPGTDSGGPERRWQQFRTFLHVQDYAAQKYKKTDPKTGKFVKQDMATAGPLNKLEPMISYVRMKWGRGWRAGMILSLDEQTIGYKGRCALVVRIKDKGEGDGFQCDAICEDGYTITFCFRCDNLPCAADKNVSDRDTRCAWLVDQLQGAWHHLYMDNLFTSWKFGEMLAARQCLFAGTCTVQVWRGLHREVVQKEVTKKEELEKAKGTLKASVRKMANAEKCDVICCSYYDEKPFHMMGNTTSGVTVVEFYRKCFSTATQAPAAR